MNSLRRCAITCVRSLTHFWLANSAVQITSMPITSHSDDLAWRRWTSWLRCSSADSESSSRLALIADCDLLNAAIVLWNAPLTSLGRQRVTLPFAPLAALGESTRLWSTPCDLPPPPPPLLLLLLPQPTTRAAQSAAAA